MYATSLLDKLSKLFKKEGSPMYSTDYINDIINHPYLNDDILNDIIQHIDEITIREHTSEKELVDDDFDFVKGLELEGYFLVPQADGIVFDCGDHGDNGILLPHTSPLDDLYTFRQNLTDDLWEIKRILNTYKH